MSAVFCAAPHVAAKLSVQPQVQQFEVVNSCHREDISAKYLASASGGYGRFAQGVNPRDLIHEALSSPAALLRPDANPGRLRAVLDFGEVIGLRGQTVIRVVVTFGRDIVTAGEGISRALI